MFRFFYIKVTKPEIPGEERKARQFDIRLTILNEATIDILFSKVCYQIFYYSKILFLTIKTFGFYLCFQKNLLVIF